MQGEGWLVDLPLSCFSPQALDENLTLFLGQPRVGVELSVSSGGVICSLGTMHE